MKKKILIIIISIIITIGAIFPIYLITLNDKQNELQNNIINNKNLLINDIILETQNVLNTFKLILESNKEIILELGKSEISEDLFLRITNIENFLYRDSIENIRYSPIIYHSELANHENSIFSQQLKPGYQIRDYNLTITDIPVTFPRSSNRSFYFPIYISSPPFFNQELIGSDLWFNSPLIAAFLESFNNETFNNFLVSGPLNFIRGKFDTDFGIYIGNLIHKCSYFSNSFLNFVIDNEDSKCIFGSSYSAVLVSDFFNAIILASGSRNKEELGDFSLSYQIFDENMVIYYQPPNNIAFQNYQFKESDLIITDNNILVLKLNFLIKKHLFYI